MAIIAIAIGALIFVFISEDARRPGHIVCQQVFVDILFPLLSRSRIQSSRFEECLLLAPALCYSITALDIHGGLHVI